MWIFFPSYHLYPQKGGEKLIELYQLMDFRAPQARGKFQSSMKNCSPPLTAPLILDDTNPNDIWYNRIGFRPYPDYASEYGFRIRVVYVDVCHKLIFVMKGRLGPEYQWLNISSLVLLGVGWQAAGFIRCYGTYKADRL